MKKQWKRVPFTIELAKKIQSGEVEGRIVTNEGNEVEIIRFDLLQNSFPILAIIHIPNVVSDYWEDAKLFQLNGEHGNKKLWLEIELPEEAPEEQHPIEESELYQAGYKAGFEAGRCAAFDEKKGCVIKKEAPKYDDVEEVPTGDGSIVFLRHKKHEFKVGDKVIIHLKSNTGTCQYLKPKYDNQRGIISSKNDEMFWVTLVDGENKGTKLLLAENDIEHTVCWFKPFDKVLVRDISGQWSGAYYSHYDKEEDKHSCGGVLFDECIPYEGNEHLIGTTNNPEQL